MPIPAAQDTLILYGVAVPGDFIRMAGTAMLKSGSKLFQVDFNAVADARSRPHCYLYGTATRAMG